ncbi:hypothetical protein [Natronococcus pandeyae]|nr:hypothetical protein [Natronococcus pandeyae]
MNYSSNRRETGSIERASGAVHLRGVNDLQEPIRMISTSLQLLETEIWTI